MRENKTLADYVAIAISPALIMALVGSLVFFLVEVLYVGQYQARLLWILFFFVFGAVLIARIAMQSDISNRAGMYGLILGGLTWLALLLYVEYPDRTGLAAFGWAINLVLIAIIWWSAYRLTWDCTLIDDSVDASGAGLLERAGLEQSTEGKPAPSQPAEEPKRKKPEATGLAGWRQRYRQYREECRKQPHTPGVWVVYFSLGALPLFGLGQMLIAADSSRRLDARAAGQRYVFLLMTIYVASGLGLLLTTSFLGLRRYLRQRKLQMPPAVTGGWLTVGVILMVALIVVGALLPRPSAEYRGVLEWIGVVSPERKASDLAQKRDGAGTGKGQASQDKKGTDGQNGKGSGKDDKSKSNEPSGKGGEAAQSGGGQDKGKKSGQDGQGGEGSGDTEHGDRSAEPSWRADVIDWLQDFGPLPTVLKWLVGILVLLVAIFVLLRWGLGFLANFTHWARRLLEALQAMWQRLTQWWRSQSPAEEAEEETAARPVRPFALFRDPFLSGDAQRLSPNDLVRYSFEALEAWAVERGMGRQTGETPLEFAERIGQEVPALELDVAQLAGFYAGLAYARRSLTRDCHETLKRFWRLLVEVIERPLSASV